MREPHQPSDAQLWALAYGISTAWHVTLGAGALYLELSPLPAVRDAIGGWPGTLAAIALGATIFAAIGLVIRALKAFIGGLDTRNPLPGAEDTEAPPRA